MASSVPILLLLSVVLFPVAVAGFDTRCTVYGDNYSKYQQCISTAENGSFVYVLLVTGSCFVILILICCCCCPCCCLYNTCRKSRPVVGTTTTTTVVNTQCVMQQPVIQGGQYPTYQPVPTQPGYGGQPAYGGQPMPTAPYQGQSYTPGPPPPYHTVGPGYPSTQAMYPVHTPDQAGCVHAPPSADMFKQPAYNPAYVQSPGAGY